VSIGILESLLLAIGCSSSQIAIERPVAVPLWKVIVGSRADELNRTRKGPVFLGLELHGPADASSLDANPADTIPIAHQVPPVGHFA
jgi:hypothetical protein